MDDWRPITEAQKDGHPYLLFARARHATAKVRVVGWWNPMEGWIECCFSPNAPVGLDDVTHYAPLPPFPAWSPAE